MGRGYYKWASGRMLCATGGMGIGSESTKLTLIYGWEIIVGSGYDDFDAEADATKNIPNHCPLIGSPNSSSCSAVIACLARPIAHTWPPLPPASRSGPRSLDNWGFPGHHPLASYSHPSSHAWAASWTSGLTSYWTIASPNCGIGGPNYCASDSPASWEFSRVGCLVSTTSSYCWISGASCQAVYTSRGHWTNGQARILRRWGHSRRGSRAHGEAGIQITSVFKAW